MSGNRGFKTANGADSGLFLAGKAGWTFGFSNLVSQRCHNYDSFEEGSAVSAFLSVQRRHIGLSTTDTFVNFLIENAIIGSSTLFTSHLSRLMIRLERRLLHGSVPH